MNESNSSMQEDIMRFDSAVPFKVSKFKGPCVVDDDDKKTLKWIHGGTNKSLSNIVHLSDSDIWYLLEHLLLNLMNLMLGRTTLGGAMPDADGEEQLLNWRLINLLCIKPGKFTKDDVREKFLEMCEVHQVENDPAIVELFERYVV